MKSNLRHLKLLFCLLFLWATHADANSQTDVANVLVGGQQVSIPAPKTFSQATTPRMIQIGELATIKEDRLLAVFGERADVLNESKGNRFLMNRYAFAQATRNVEPYQIPLAQFAKYKSDTKSQITAGMTEADRADVQKTLERTAKWVDSNMRKRIEIRMPKLGSFSILDETPKSLTLITKITSSISDANGREKPVELVEGISQILVNSKVVWLQLYSRSTSQEDFYWVVENIVKWTRDVSAANH